MLAREIRTEVRIAAPPQRVWAVLTDFGTYGQWNPFFVAVTGVAEPGAALSLRTKLFERSTPRNFAVTVRVADPARKLEWGGGLGIPRLMDGVHGFELTADGGGTAVRHYERLTGLLVPPAGRLVSTLEKRYLTLNDALRRRAEQIAP
ncbi:MAG: SRPBCC domain-containing protein [Mycobacteriaceae bacterium]|nr:SRPBCC domain-containing protein [Mycobacteriaceae bacterium]